MIVNFTANEVNSFCDGNVCKLSTYNRRNKNQPDELFERMNKYHPNMNLTVEVNSSKFLDKNISRHNEIKCFAYHKEIKLLFHWTSAVPKTLQKNVIIEDLHRVKNLSSNFEQEVRIINDNYMKAGYPFRFINSVIDGFNQEKEDLLTPTTVFEERKEVSFQIPFSILELLTNWKRLLTVK